MPSVFTHTGYKELATSDDGGSPSSEHPDTQDASRWRNSASRRSWLGTTAIVVMAWLFGVFIGRQSAPTRVAETYNHGLLNPPGQIHEVWEHNLTFSDKPTPESEAAWNSIVPIGRGFVTHADVAPFISNVAVFHQMHCLHAIRVAYYVDEHSLAVQAGTAAPDPYMERMAYTVNRRHMRHCFDYLRRALMCAADANLESVTPAKHVTTGWGDARVCRDYAGVRAWAERWRNTDDVGIAEPPPETIPAKAKPDAQHHAENGHGDSAASTTSRSRSRRRL